MSQRATEDLYATLGVAPRSEAAVIRAAYLALMRLYHPDKNDSPAAVERAHAIIAAFSVLGDAEKRLHYDWARRRAAEAAAQPRRWNLGRLPRPLIAAVLALIVLAPFVTMQSPPTERDHVVGPTVLKGDVDHDPILVAKTPIAAPRLALTTIRASQPDAMVASVPLEPRAAKPRPHVAEPMLLPALTPRASPALRERPKVRSTVRREVPAFRANSRCRFVKAGAETAICDNNNLAALDLNVVTFYNQSLAFGTAKKRDALLDSRASFLARREQCRSDACLQSLHLSHLREMSSIVENRSPEPPR